MATGTNSALVDSVRENGNW